MQKVDVNNLSGIAVGLSEQMDSVECVPSSMHIDLNVAAMTLKSRPQSPHRKATMPHS